MHPEAYLATSAPTHPPTEASTSLFLLHGRWVAACSACGYQLARYRSQRRAERTARRRGCPVCGRPGDARPRRPGPVP